MSIELLISSSTNHNYQINSGLEAISTTANASGFTTMNAILDENNIQENEALANFVNQSEDIYFLERELSPAIILVPKIYYSGFGSKITKKIIDLCYQKKINTLYFSHFEFIKKKLPVELVSEIIREFRDARLVNHHLNVFFQIDESHKKQMENLLRSIT